MTDIVNSKLSSSKTKQHQNRLGNTWNTILFQKQLVFMSFPLLLYMVFFHYVPLWGWLIAFQNYKPGKGILDQIWVGFDQFKFIFTQQSFLLVLRNTVAMSVINIVLGFVTSIVLALLLNELRNMFFKRIVQTISYLPYFISWVIACTIVSTSLSTEDGIVNIILARLHIIESPILWLSEGKYFWIINGLSGVWKNVGFGAIVYLGVIASIDPSLYESAEIDGANRYRKMLHITLPGLKSIFIVLLIMSIGNVLNAGFEFQYLLGNGLNVDWSQTIDVFVMQYGITMGNYSLATAAGMFKTTVSLVLLFAANYTARKIGEERLI